MTIVRGVWNHHSYTVGHSTTKSWNSSDYSYSSTLHSLHYFRRFSSLAIYMYMSLCPLQHSLIAISSSWFSAKWMWSDPSPLCYTQPNLFTNSSCAFYLKLVQNLHCVLVSWIIWGISTFGGGVTHRIRMMISDTAYNCRRVLRIKFFVNFFTLRVLFFIDWRKTFLHVLHI